MTSKDTKRFFSFEDVKQDELVFSWEPSQELYDELIEELNLVILKNTVLNGRFVTRKHGRLLKLQGSLKADVVQSCGITLEPIKTNSETSISLFAYRLRLSACAKSSLSASCIAAS